VNAADPVVDGNRVMISSSNGSVCLQIQPGKNPEPKPVWEQKALRTYFNPTVRVGGYIYAISGTTHRPTELVCLDWKTGEIRWKEPGFGSGALMAAGDRLVIFDKGRLTICLATADGFAPLLQAQILGGKCWTAPVVANGRVFCRNAKGDLACVDLLPQ
jgi:outer membrane protein assembly factor BamB